MTSRYWKRRFLGFLFFLAFLTTIPLSNYVVLNWGTICSAESCLVPVWFYPKIYAVSSVVVVGFNFVLRDLVQRGLGLKYAILAVLLGTLLSYLVSSPLVATASAITFLVSETVNTVVYTPLQRKHFILAIIAAGIAGIIVDSAIFLKLAFNSLEFLPGSIIGKMWAVVVCIPLIYILRKKIKF